ncbi:hypothetical protein LINPERHAP2_LOCUS33641 [Linum perenne]
MHMKLMPSFRQWELDFYLNEFDRRSRCS